MADDVMTKIVDRCLSLEEAAIQVYRELASCCVIPELKRFWNEMSQAESTHVRFWRKLKDIAHESSLPQIFDDPEAIHRELAETWAKVQALLVQCKGTSLAQDAFVVACRLEFFLLHPSFSTFFHNARAIVGDESIAVVYEAHLNLLVEMLAQYGPQTPEMDIIKESLQRLWKGNRTLAEQAFSDSLTGLLNRRGFLRIAEHLIYLARRRSEGTGLFMIDIDNFKKINERYGHEKGDQALVHLGKAIKSSVRASDLVCRYGGEEFVVFLFGTDFQGSQVVGEKVRGAVERLLFRVPLTVSVGVATSAARPESALDIQDLIRRADHSMYIAKQTGKNRVVAEGA